jgi:hypothetical protein
MSYIATIRTPVIANPIATALARAAVLDAIPMTFAAEDII